MRLNLKIYLRFEFKYQNLISISSFLGFANLTKNASDSLLSKDKREGLFFDQIRLESTCHNLARLSRNLLQVALQKDANLTVEKSGY